MSHIDALQALVVIQHASGQFNLYLSDITAVYFSLSLANLTHSGFVLDLDIVSIPSDRLGYCEYTEC